VSCEIIQFSTAARVSPKRCKQERERPPRDEGELSTTCKNSRLRDARKDAWRQAEVICEYWRARRDMESAIWCAQRHDLPEGNNHPTHVPDESWTLLANWRQAIARQLLTPAPTGAAVAWKRAKLRGWDSYLPVKADRVERVIADDIAFLAAHPTKRGKAVQS
jgi:hypothetical protein